MVSIINNFYSHSKILFPYIRKRSSKLMLASILTIKDNMKTLLMVLLLMPFVLSGATLYVALDGSQAYSSIQSAVNAAADQILSSSTPAPTMRILRLLAGTSASGAWSSLLRIAHTSHKR